MPPKFLLLLLILTLGCTRPRSKVFYFEHQNEKRSYLLHLPTGYQAGSHLPLVLNFHGLAGSPKQQEKYTKMSELADNEKFIVVYPKGINKFWNTGLGKDSYKYGRDDVGFVNKLLDTLLAKYSIDKKRVYFTGLSLGGFFSYRLSCELRDRVAAIASVAGVISDSTAANCNNFAPIPMLQIHGTKDHIVAYEGIKSSLSVEKTLDFWVQKNQCKSTDTTLLPNTNLKDKSSVLLIKHQNCISQSEIWFYKIINGGHTWPGTEIDYLITGRINKDVQGSTLIWNFLKKYQR